MNEEDGESEFSNELLFALGSIPATPQAPYKDIQGSSKTSILVKWDAVADETLPVLGYRLYADTGHRDEPRLVFDGVNLADTLMFLYDQDQNGG